MVSSTDDTPDRDALGDRLLDVALREVVGAQTPPDLSARILERASSKDFSQPLVAGAVEMAPKDVQAKRRRSPWLMGAIAAMLFVGAGALLLPALNSGREAARSASDSLNRDSQTSIAVQPLENAEQWRYGSSLSEETESASLATNGQAVALGKTEASVAQSGKDDRWDPMYQATEAPPFAPEGGGQRQNGRSNVNSHGTIPAIAGPAAEDRYSTLATDVPAVAGEAGQGQQADESNYVPDLDTPFRQQSFGLVGDGERSGAAAPAARPATDSLTMLVEPHVIAQSQERDALAVKAGVPTTAAVPASARAPAATPGQAPTPLRIWHRAEGKRGAQLAGNGAIPEWHEGQPEPQHLINDVYGVGPGLSGDQYQRIEENPFKAISAASTDNRLSTFSIDVDTASYANVRQFLMQSSALPPADAVRIEELVNYFDYDYTPPTGDVPFAANVEVASCPWTPEHRLVRIGIKGREMDRAKRPQSNLVFLVDVSGSMDEPNKLPLLVEGLRMLTQELGENDRVAIAVYASNEGLALESTRGTDQSKILAALDQLSAGGSTAGGAGIQLAYKVAADNFIKGGVNRVILCTDGDFNVGVTSPAELERMAEEKAKETGVFLTVLGFGRGNLNDAMMEQIADKGNGNYHYVDGRSEARKVLVEEMSGTLVTIAKDVKIQVEFNPAKVAGYRLVGYENRVMTAEDFNDDKKDAGEIGAGHTVTALYEVVPAGKQVDAVGVDELKYEASKPEETDEDGGADAQELGSGELLTLKIRYKEPDGDESTKLEFPVEDNDQKFAAASEDFKFASAVACFGMLLRDSQYAGNATLAAVAEIAESASKRRDPNGYRAEFVKMVQRAKELRGE